MQSNCKNIHSGCLEIIETICEELGDGMNQEVSSKIQGHIKYCPGCEAYFKSLEKTLDVYKNCKEEIPKDLYSRVLERIQLDMAD